MPETTPKITLPADLRPRDGRFGSGPSKVRPEQVAALADAAPAYLGTSHRQSPVRSVVGRVRAGLRDLFSLPDGYQVVLGNGGTTVLWDALIFGFIEARSQHLSFGEFSAKFASGVAAAPHLEDPDVIASEPGTHPDPAARPGIDTYALTHNETSTGVCMPIARVDGADPGALVIVDATSAAGGLRVDVAQSDLYYFAPQKCFASDGGLWLALCSPAALERIDRIAASGRYIPPSISLAVAAENSRQDQTYNTPALATLLMLAEQVEWFNSNGGLEWAASRCDQSAEIVYGWAEKSEYATPFVIEPAMRSTVTATIDLDGRAASTDVTAVLRANGVVDLDGYRKLGRNQLRIALFPAIEPDDLATLTRAIDYVVDALTSS
jgi:phosphoserine aminotransferase